jgi:Na+-transporting NADH:ubiquinone oxidoreductase subunit NqrE
MQRGHPRQQIIQIITVQIVLVYDFLANQGAIAFFLALKFLDLVEYLAFWR